jgi:hypothetical protein
MRFYLAVIFDKQIDVEDRQTFWFFYGCWARVSLEIEEMTRDQMTFIVTNPSAFFVAGANLANPTEYKLCMFAKYVMEMQKYLEFYHAFIKKDLSKIDPDLHLNNATFSDKLMETYADLTFGLIYRDFGFSSLVFLDVYLLSKLFTKYDESKMQRGPMYCRTSYRNSRNCVINVGTQHTQVYQLFLYKVFGATPTIEKENEHKEKQWVEMTDPFDYWVSSK